MFSSALKSFSSNITANYTISTTPTSIAGAWKVYDGKNKKTGKVVSVFVFEKQYLESQGIGGLRSQSNAASRKKIFDQVVERLKKEAAFLAKLRHPNILELAEPVEDTRHGGLMFATEAIISTLASLLLDEDDRDRSNRSRSAGKEELIDELEIQKGLLQVAKGLEFLHESAGLVHGNLTPEAIYINQKSDWKIAGLGFTGSPDTITNSTTPAMALSECLYHEPRLPRSVQLNFDYTSPDFVMDSNISSSADMFSLGLVVLALYNSPHESPLHSNSNVSAYKKLFSSSSTTPTPSNNYLCPSTSLPQEVITEVLPRLITRRPAQRMNAREFQQSRFFDNILVSTLRFLDSLPTKTPNEKAQFFRGLPRIIDKFPKAVLDRKILPTLLDETVDSELLASILQIIFKLIKTLPSGQRAFTDRVLPRLGELFVPNPGKSGSSERNTTKEAGLVVLLENISVIADNCSGKEFRDGVLPIIVLSLESPTHAIVDKSLGTISTILAVLDFSTIKNELFPIVAAVFSKTNSLAIKVRGLEAFNLLCGGVAGITNGRQNVLNRKSLSNIPGVLDKYTVQEKIVPLLKVIKTKEPAVMMAALAVFRQIAQIADSDFLAMEVLPILWSFSLGPLLDLQQFSEYMSLIKSISDKIEQEHTKKLKELSLNSTNGSSKSLVKDSMGMDALDSMLGSSTIDEGDFERLVLGKPTPPINQTSSAPPPLQSSLSTQSLLPTSPWPNQKANLPPGILSPQSRTITPDQSQSLRSFAPLQASQPTPNTISTNNHNNMNTTWPTILPPPSQSQTLFQSSTQPSLYQPSAQTPYQPPSSWQTSRSSILTTPNTNGWSIPPPPTASNAINPAFAAHPGTRVQLGNGSGLLPATMGSIGSQQQQQNSSGAFGIPPSGGGGTLGGQQRQKTVLDRYESLI